MKSSARAYAQIDSRFTEQVHLATENLRPGDNGVIELHGLQVPSELSRALEYDIWRPLAHDGLVDLNLSFDEKSRQLTVDHLTAHLANGNGTAHIQRSHSLPSYLPYLESTAGKVKSGYLPLVRLSSEEILNLADIQTLPGDAEALEVAEWRQRVLQRAASWSIARHHDYIESVNAQSMTMIRTSRKEIMNEGPVGIDTRTVERIVEVPLEGESVTLHTHAVLETEQSNGKKPSFRSYQKLYTTDTSLHGIILGGEPAPTQEAVNLLDTDNFRKYSDLADTALRDAQKRAA